MSTECQVVFHMEEKRVLDKLSTIPISLLLQFLTVRDRSALVVTKFLRTVLEGIKLDLFDTTSLTLWRVESLLHRRTNIIGLNIKSYNIDPTVLITNLPKLSKLKLVQTTDFGFQKIRFANHQYYETLTRLPPKRWNINFLTTAVNLTHLVLEAASVDFIPVTACSNLVRLELKQHSSSVSELWKLPKLKYLALTLSYSLLNPDIRDLPELEEVVLGDSQSITVPPFTGCPKLTALTVHSAWTVIFPSGFASDVKLEKISTKNTPRLTIAPCLMAQSTYRELRLEHGRPIINFDWVETCSKLETVAITSRFSFSVNVDLTPFTKCPKLTSLTLGQGVYDYSILAAFPALLDVTLTATVDYYRISFALPTDRYSGLLRLKIDDCAGETDNINFLETCPNLQVLDVYRVTGDLSPIGLCSQLKTLIIRNCAEVSTYQFLTQCPKLETVSLNCDILSSELKYGTKLVCLNATTLTKNINLEPFSELEKVVLAIHDQEILIGEEAFLPIRGMNGEIKICLWEDDLPLGEKSVSGIGEKSVSGIGEKSVSGIGEKSVSGVEEVNPPEEEKSASGIGEKSSPKKAKLIDPVQIMGNPNIRVMEVYVIGKCNEVVFQNRLPRLRTLIMKRCHSDNWNMCPNVTEITISDSTVTSISQLGKCLLLEELILSGNKELNTISPLAQLTNLRCLNLYACFSLTNINFLRDCKSLEWLDLNQCSDIWDISILATCTGLVKLNLASLEKLIDLTPISSCSKLQSLDLGNSHNITDISPLAQCRELNEVNMENLFRLRTIFSLAQCQKLRLLDIKRCFAITDLREYILASPTLEVMWLSHITVVDMQSPTALEIALRVLKEADTIIL